MYDGPDFDYDILDVVHLLRLHKRRGNYYDCPFCGDTKGRLNIHPAKNVFRCNRCDRSGGMLQLYADLHNLTYREANQEIREALNKGEYREAQQAKKKAQAEPEQSKLAPLEVRHRTYKEMLDLLPLYEIHKENLLERGLTMEQIKERRYKSVPLYGLHKLAESLLERDCELEGVPGFYQDDTGRWTMNFKAKNSGFLVPVESVDGNIQACQIRLDQPRDNNKYLWFSSAGYPGGTSSGSPVHVIGDPDAETVYLTEGGLKGSIAHYLSGNTFICAAGVNMYRSVRPVLEELQHRKMKRLVETYDMDKKLKTDCDRQYHKCSQCQAHGNRKHARTRWKSGGLSRTPVGKSTGSAGSYPCRSPGWSGTRTQMVTGPERSKGSMTIITQRGLKNQPLCQRRKELEQKDEKGRTAAVAGRDPSFHRCADLFSVEAAGHLRGIPGGRRYL